MILPDPVLREHEGIMVVRDDLLPGGTKRRALHVLFDDDHQEYVYASPVWGYAQVALAHACRDHGKRAVVFCAQRGCRPPLTRQAEEAGARIEEVRPGYLSVVSARAREYCRQTGAQLLPFGFSSPRFLAALADIAQRLPVSPSEVWSVAGSGALTRALQAAWPSARFYAVRIGTEPEAGRAEVLVAPERYEFNAHIRPPFPSCLNYDAKAWRFIKQRASPGALFWNVGA